MLSRDYRDMVGGGLLLVGGVMFLVYALQHYQLGTLRAMGPGMFPTAAGSLLAFFGALLLITACLRPGAMPEIKILSPLVVLGSIAAFALVVRPFGVIPAVVAVTAVSSFSDLKLRVRSTVILCVALSVVAYLLFKVGLNLPLTMFNWPF